MTRSRLACFILGILGGLIAGVGALATWRTVDFANGITTIKGTDVIWGKIALALAVVTVVAVLGARVADTDQPRPFAAVSPLLSGIALAVIGALAWPVESFVYGDNLTEAERQIVREAGEILARGPGPALLITGGVILVAAGVAGIAWTRAWKRRLSPTPLETDQQGEADPS